MSALQLSYQDNYILHSRHIKIPKAHFHVPLTHVYLMTHIVQVTSVLGDLRRDQSNLTPSFLSISLCAVTAINHSDIDYC